MRSQRYGLERARCSPEDRRIGLGNTFMDQSRERLQKLAGRRRKV